MVLVPRGVRAGLAALVLVAGASAPAVAQGPQTTDPTRSTKDQKTAVDRERNRLAQRYDETLSVEADLVAAYQQSQAASAVLTLKVQDLDNHIAAVQQQLDVAAAAAERAVLKRDGLRQDERAAKTLLSRRRAELQATAISGYVWFGERGTIHTAYGQALSADELLLSGYYATYIDDVERERVQLVEAQERRVTAIAKAASDASDRADRARQEVAQERAELQRARDEQAAAKAAADAEVERQRQLVAEVQAKRAAYEARLRDLESESRQLGDLLRATQAAQTAKAVAAPPAAPKPVAPRPAPTAKPPVRPPTKPSPSTAPPVRPTSAPAPGMTSPAAPPTTNNAGAGPPPPIAVQLGYPLPGYPVVSTYGWRVHPILGVRKLHEGIDIGAPEGTPIHAAAAGTVIWAGPRNGYGNAVIIDHGSGVGTVYAHQSAVAVSVGQGVGRGEVVGYVGHTGLAVTPHLHFEVRVGGHTYDPLAYVHPS
jgi:murein DD-endopeptidase MepM/ murein hydrolase activator NlpD